MSWVVTLEEVRDRKVLRRRTLMTIDRPITIDSADDIGLRSEDARQLLSTLLPIDSGVTHTTIRNRTAHVAAALEREESGSGIDVPAAPELVPGLDTAHVRSTTPRSGHHHPVLVGCVERQRRRRYLAVMQHKTSAASTTIRTQLDAMGYRPGTTDLTVFTDGANVPRGLARAACGAPVTPILDGFHIAIRLQHMRHSARGLSARVHTHRVAREAIEQELEKLRWRL